MISHPTDLTTGPLASAHQRSIRGQPQQRDQHERQPEREDDLGDHQHGGRVGTDREHDQGGIRVITRRSSRLTLRCSRPSMITLPA